METTKIWNWIYTRVSKSLDYVLAIYKLDQNNTNMLKNYTKNVFQARRSVNAKKKQSVFFAAPTFPQNYMVTIYTGFFGCLFGSDCERSMLGSEWMVTVWTVTTENLSVHLIQTDTVFFSALWVLLKYGHW